MIICKPNQTLSSFHKSLKSCVSRKGLSLSLNSKPRPGYECQEKIRSTVCEENRYNSETAKVNDDFSYEKVSTLQGLFEPAKKI